MTPSYRVDLANWPLYPNLVTIAQSRCSHFTLNFLSLHMVWLQAGHEDEHLMIPWPFSTNQSSVLAHSWIGTNTTHASPPCCHWESFCGVIFCCSACRGLSVHSYSDLSYSFSCEPFIRLKKRFCNACWDCLKHRDGLDSPLCQISFNVTPPIALCESLDSCIMPLFFRVMLSGFATSQSPNICYLWRAHVGVDVMPHALFGSPTLLFSSQVSPRPLPRAQTSIRWTLYILGFVLSTICQSVPFKILLGVLIVILMG